MLWCKHQSLSKVIKINKFRNMNINEIQDEIIEEFSSFDDWMDKYNYLIEMSADAPVYEESRKTPANLIEGCQSRVWIDAELNEDGSIHYMAESDAILVKGLVALLLRVFDNRTADEILTTELYFIDKIGMKENLSPTRANGLVSMIKQIQMYALAFKSKIK